MRLPCSRAAYIVQARLPYDLSLGSFDRRPSDEIRQHT